MTAGALLLLSYITDALSAREGTRTETLEGPESLSGGQINDPSWSRAIVPTWNTLQGPSASPASCIAYRTTEMQGQYLVKHTKQGGPRKDTVKNK